MASRLTRFAVALLCCAACAAGGVYSQTNDRGTPPLQELSEQNRKLQDQVAEQQKTIDQLKAAVDEMRRASERQDRELRALREGTDTTPAEHNANAAGDAVVRVSGETGVAFFETGTRGQFPKAEFRLDDPKLLIEAKVWEDVYAVMQLDLLTRESSDESVYIGALYADWENLGRAWMGDHALNLRAGRFAIPFGEEYQTRNVMDNALISHSLSDVWGFDEGVELFGSKHGLSYTLAVQNGGISRVRDFNADKSVSGRLGIDPLPWLHLSASAMRTGALSAKQDAYSELWFGNGLFRAIGPAATTQNFHAELYEFDAGVHWRTGRIAGAIGLVHFNDDAPAANDVRHMRYWFVEAQQNLTENWYGAARVSAIHVPNGYPLVGFGNAGNYFYNPAAPLTNELKRFSLGLGYRFAPPIVLKIEYGLEQGETVTGGERDYEDFFSTELGLRF